MNVTHSQIQMVFSEIQKIEAGASGRAHDLYLAARQASCAIKADRSSFREKVEILKDLGHLIDKITALSEKHVQESRQSIQLARAAMGTRS